MGPVTPEDMAKVGLLLTLSESADEATFKQTLEACRSSSNDVPVIGFTGTGGAGKIKYPIAFPFDDGAR